MQNSIPWRSRDNLLLLAGNVEVVPREVELTPHCCCGLLLLLSGDVELAPRRGGGTHDLLGGDVELQQVNAAAASFTPYIIWQLPLPP